MTSSERLYWRRKLPARFQLVLERVGRAIVRENPANVLAYAATYLEQKLLEQQAELRALPKHSYLKQLLEKKFKTASSIPPRNDSGADHADAILTSAEAPTPEECCTDTNGPIVDKKIDEVTVSEPSLPVVEKTEEQHQGQPESAVGVSKTDTVNMEQIEDIRPMLKKGSELSAIAIATEAVRIDIDLSVQHCEGDRKDILSETLVQHAATTEDETEKPTDETKAQPEAQTVETTEVPGADEHLTQPTDTAPVSQPGEPVTVAQETHEPAVENVSGEQQPTQAIAETVSDVQSTPAETEIVSVDAEETKETENVHKEPTVDDTSTYKVDRQTPEPEQSIEKAPKSESLTAKYQEPTESVEKSNVADTDAQTEQQLTQEEDQPVLTEETAEHQKEPEAEPEAQASTQIIDVQEATQKAETQESTHVDDTRETTQETETQESKQIVDAQESTQETETQDSTQLVDTQEAVQETETQESKQIVDMQEATQETETQETKQIVDAQESTQKTETQDSTQLVDTQETAQETETQESKQIVDTQEATQETETQESKQIVDAQEATQETETQESTQLVDTQEAVQETETQESKQIVDTQEATQETETQESTQLVDTQEATQETERQECKQLFDTQEATQETEIQETTQIVDTRETTQETETLESTQIDTKQETTQETEIPAFETKEDSASVTPECTEDAEAVTAANTDIIKEDTATNVIEETTPVPEETKLVHDTDIPESERQESIDETHELPAVEAQTEANEEKQELAQDATQLESKAAIEDASDASGDQLQSEEPTEALGEKTTPKPEQPERTTDKQESDTQECNDDAPEPPAVEAQPGSKEEKLEQDTSQTQETNTHITTTEDATDVSGDHPQPEEAREAPIEEQEPAQNVTETEEAPEVSTEEPSRHEGEQTVAAQELVPAQKEHASVAIPNAESECTQTEESSAAAQASVIANVVEDGSKANESETDTTPVQELVSIQDMSPKIEAPDTQGSAASESVVSNSSVPNGEIQKSGQQQTESVAE